MAAMSESKSHSSAVDHEHPSSIAERFVDGFMHPGLEHDAERLARGYQDLEEQLETLQAEYRDFVNEISFPTFEDSRIEWVEVQIDKDVLAGARSRTASFPAKSQEDE